MKLEPVAKPIRIRIKIGRNEYSNLDDVRKNFSLKDLYPLYLDGRLSRWLNQIGEFSIAQKVQSLVNEQGKETLDGYIYFMSLFFDKISKSIDEIEKNRRLVIPADLSLFSFESLLLIFENSYELSNLDWPKLIEPLLCKENVEKFYQNEKFYSLFSSEEWGQLFARIVDTKESYINTIVFLENNSIYPIETSSVLVAFYKSALRCGYDINDMLELITVQDVLRWYSNQVLCTEVNWQDLLICKLNFSDALVLYEDSSVINLVGIEGRGGFLAKLVSSTEDYKVAFHFLEKKSHEKQSDVANLGNFIFESKERGYLCNEIVLEDISLDELLEYYKNRIIQESITDWGKLLADKITDWEIEFPKIEELILSSNDIYEDFCYYYKQRTGKDISEILDPWSIIEKSNEEKEIISHIIRNSTANINYFEQQLSSKYALQLLDLILYIRYGGDKTELQKSYLSVEYEVIRIFKSRKPEGYFYDLGTLNRQKLKSIIANRTGNGLSSKMAELALKHENNDYTLFRKECLSAINKKIMTK